MLILRTVSSIKRRQKNCHRLTFWGAQWIAQVCLQQLILVCFTRHHSKLPAQLIADFDWFSHAPITRNQNMFNGILLAKIAQLFQLFGHVQSRPLCCVPIYNVTFQVSATRPIQHFLLGKGSGPNVEIRKHSTMSRTICSVIDASSNCDFAEEVPWDSIQFNVGVNNVNSCFFSILNWYDTFMKTEVS